MKREIYVQSSTPRHLAVVEDGKLVEYLKEREDASAAEGIYLGRVERVVNGMQAAFVSIGQEKNGFLPLKERSATARLQPLSSGARVLVQVKKEAQGEKGAFLTRDITLCGQYVLLMPCNRYVGVSARVTEEADKSALRALGAELSGGQFGLVMRHAALEAAREDVQAELETLLSAWHEVEKQAPTAHAPSLLYRPRTLLDGLLDDYLPRGVTCVVTDDETLSIEGVPVERTACEKGSLMESAGLTRARDKALERRVWLESGGNLVFDLCEAMTVIDVNTAKFTGKRALEATIRQTNLEAAQEIARQVRLRNLGGMILIDLIDMEAEQDRQDVLNALETAFAADRVKTVVHGFTSLGLVEMTRKKVRAPLWQDWMEACPACRGAGRVRKEEQHG